MNVPNDVMKNLKNELNEVLESLDSKYYDEIKFLYGLLIVLIPITIIGIIIAIYESYVISLGIFLIVFVIAIFFTIRNMIIRYFWKKEREKAIFIFNIKVLQASLQHIMKVAESAETEIDSTEESHR